MLYGQQKPVQPELYVLDHPGTAFAIGGEAKNISLQFKTCLYRTADVPLSRPAADVNLAGALTCWEWTSSYLYDHAAGRYESKADLHPACLTAPQAPAPTPSAPSLSGVVLPTGAPDFDGAD